MSSYKLIETLSDTTPTTAVGTTVSAETATGLDRFSYFMIEADLIGATGGTLDVYLQRKLQNNEWRDWVHFPQLASSAAAIKHTIASHAGLGVIETVGGGTDALPGVALAASRSVGGHPGTDVRAVYVPGATTTVGAAVKIRIYGLRA